MPYGFYSLADVARDRPMLKLGCEACGRRRKYLVDRLLDRFPPDIALLTSAMSSRNVPVAGACWSRVRSNT
jgi:hypothetical protein